MRIPIILDTDPGIDDAAAIAAALFAPELDLALMTTVAGNVSLEKTTRNALQLLHFWEVDVPLAQGASAPLVRPLRDAADVHGESGMEGYDFVAHDRQPLAKPAFIAIRDLLMSAPQPVTLVAIGPLTNIALLLTQYPECKFNIRRLVLMGGSAGRGNFTPNAEFNIAIDPEAAAIVFRSGLEIVMCGLDVTNDAMLDAEYLATLPTLNRTGQMLHALFSHYRSGSMTSGLRMHDLCAIAWLVRPDLFTLKPCFVAVET
jgi:non-specific riboncleoside hydrolase